MIKYHMYVETDMDFSLKYKGIVYSWDFTLILDDLKQLDEIEIIDPYDRSHEYQYAVEEIKKNPDKTFSNIGGNRGVRWEKVGYKNVEKELKKIANKHNVEMSNDLKNAFIAAFELGINKSDWLEYPDYWKRLEKKQ